jgi:hypothetical protein
MHEDKLVAGPRDYADMTKTGWLRAATPACKSPGPRITQRHALGGC